MKLPQQIDTFFFRFFMVWQWRSKSVASDPSYSLEELSILELIDRVDGILAKNISMFLGKPAASMSDTVSKLEKLGLLERRQKEGLEKPLCLTSSGKEVLDANRSHCTFSISHALVKKMSDSERVLIYSCLMLLNQKQQEVLEDVLRGDFET